MGNRTLKHVRLSKIQIRLCIHASCSVSLLAALSLAKDPRFVKADYEDTDQIADAQTHLRLRWTYAN